MEGEFKTKEDLEREGWTFATLTSGLHLKRILEMYEELGIATYLEEVNPETLGDCGECYSADDEMIYRVYSKPLDD